MADTTITIGSTGVVKKLVDFGDSTYGDAVATLAYGSAVSVTRPNDTTAYTANDVIGPTGGTTSALTFTLGVGAGQYLITSSALEIDLTGVISGMANYRLYLYNVTPPSALADNAAFDIPAGDRASFLGYVDLGTPVDLGSTLYVQQDAINMQITLASASLFGYLVTVGAYTPSASDVHKVTLHTIRL